MFIFYNYIRIKQHLILTFDHIFLGVEMPLYKFKLSIEGWNYKRGNICGHRKNINNILIKTLIDKRLIRIRALQMDILYQIC